MDWLTTYWDRFKAGMAFITAKIGTNGLLSVTGANNWGRTAISSGITTDGNALLYGALTGGAALATWMSDNSTASQWSTLAQGISGAILTSNWDDSTGFVILLLFPNLNDPVMSSFTNTHTPHSAFWNTADDKSNYCEDGNSMAMYYGAVDDDHAQRISSFLPTKWTPIGAETGELPGSIVMFVEGFEVKGHLAIGQTKRALDLIRLSWGWYLQSPFGTQSSFIEGYKTDGSWRYRDDSYSKLGSYTAHALGWSTGPTDALTSYVVGLRPTGPGGNTWLLAPQAGDLTSAEGGFTLPSGKFSSGWEANTTGIVTLWLNVPEATSGTIDLRFFQAGALPKSITIDGTASDATNGVIEHVGGGKHEVTFVY